MTKYVVQLKSGDTQGNVDVWVYHKMYDTVEAANDIGIAFCKDAEAELKEMNVDYEYEGTSLFVGAGDGVGWFLANAYTVFPVESDHAL